MKNYSTLKIDGFDGHLVLYCKNHYNHSGNLIEDLKRIWAIRCGYDYDPKNNGVVLNIINRLYKILYPTIKNHEVFQEQLHNHLVSWLYQDLDKLENIALFYCSELANLQIKENNKWLIKLPKLKKQVFNRILRGNGKFNDYKLIN